MIVEKISRNRTNNWHLRNNTSIKVAYGKKLYQFKKDQTVTDNAQEFVFDQFLNSKNQTITIIPNIILFNIFDNKTLSTNNSNILSTYPMMSSYFSVSIGYIVIKNKFGTSFDVKHEVLGKLHFVKNTNVLVTENGVNVISKFESKETDQANLTKLEEVCKKNIEPFYDDYIRTYQALKYKGVNNQYALNAQLIEFMSLHSDKFISETKTGTLDKTILEKVQKIVAEIKEEDKKEVTV